MYTPVGSILPTILFVAMILGGVVGVMSLLARKDPYDEIERGGLSPGRDTHATSAQAALPDAVAARSERELEIRQMLEARNARIVRNGGSPLDIESELARLTADGAEDELAKAGGRRELRQAPGAQTAEAEERALEIRQMLEARNARIVRNGGEPLDVDAEVARLLDGSAGGS